MTTSMHSPTRSTATLPTVNQLAPHTAQEASADSPLVDNHTLPTPAALSVLAAALLAACGGGGGGDATSGATTGDDSGTGGTGTGSALPVQEIPVPAAPGFNNFPQAASDEEAARFILQSQLSASDEEITALRTSAGTGTYALYLQKQFAKPIGQTGWQWLEQRGYGAADKYRYFFGKAQADFMLWSQLFTAQDSMRKRCALALSEFFVASLESAEFDWRSHGFAQYWDILVGNAFGNFRKLLEDVTLSPAMGYYLNTKGNQKEDGRGRLPDENYAREVMQLFTIGLVKLNLDGTEQTGPDGKKLESYTQDDVTNLARVFTGYDFDTSDGVRVPVLRADGSAESYTVPSRAFTQKPMSLKPERHSLLAASFLGTTVAAGTPGPAALQTALDTLFRHPNVGPFFGKQMIQRLVTSNPSPAYVARVAAAFNNDGKGVRGNLQAVWSAILLDDEARNLQNQNSTTFGKLREPMLRFVQWGRSFGIKSIGDSWKMFDTSAAADRLGQSPLHAPSVFNFFRPGFVPPNTAMASTKSTAPEFQIVNETTVGGYLNYIKDVIRYGIFTGDPLVPHLTNGEKYTSTINATYLKELALVADPAALVRRLNLLLCAGQLSAATQSIITAALAGTALRPATDKPEDIANSRLDRVCAGVLLTMASADYLVQK